MYLKESGLPKTNKENGDIKKKPLYYHIVDLYLYAYLYMEIIKF